MQYKQFAQVGFIPHLKHCWYMMAAAHVVHHAALEDPLMARATITIRGDANLKVHF